MAGMTNSITDYIGIVKVDGSEYLTGSTLFGTCTTAADEAAKKVVIEEITNFTPTHGLTIHVLFTHTNTAASPTLQFSSKSTATTYPIYAYGDSPVGNTMSTSWHDNAIVSFTFYDGALDATATAKRWIMNSGTDTGADGLASVNLANVNNADDLKAIEALTGTNGYLKKTAENTWALQTEQEASSTVAGITKIGVSGGAATYEHTHGNITNGGALQTNDVTIGNGDKLVITDSSDGNKVARASLSFGANNATNKGKALTQAGTWESFTNNPGTVTSVQVQGSSPVVSSVSTAQSGTLSTTISLASGYGDTQNPYASKTKNYVLAAPSDANGAPLFRALADTDIPSTIARLASPALTGTPTAPTVTDATDSSTTIATTAFVAAAINNKLAANDAMQFKGTIGTNGNPGTLPTADYQAGYTYRVITAGTYAGQTCEIGDLIIAVKDYNSSTASNSDWTVAQTNIDGAVTASDGAADYLTKFNGAHTVTKGPKITSGGTGFLKEDGTWATPTNNRDPGYGQITPANTSNGVSALSGNTTAVTATTYKENIKFTGANKWIVLAGANSNTAGSDELKFAHYVPSTAYVNNGPTSNQTGTRGSTFNIPKITIDEAGHVTGISSITVSLPASDNTDEKLAIASEDPSSSTAYNLIFAKQSTDSAATRYYNTGIQHIALKGTTSAEGYSILALGNSTATGTANNKKGILRLYGTSTSYTDIIGARVTSAQTLTLPSVTGGNLVGTSTTGKVGDTNKPVYINTNGVATAISYKIEKDVPPTAVFTDTTYTYTADTSIHYLSDANYVKTASVSNGVLTITTITNASSIIPITAITASVAGPTS